MKAKKYKNQPDEIWCADFGQKALREVAKELSAFHLAKGLDREIAARRMAKAALEIGLMVIDEAGGLVVGEGVNASRDNIIAGLRDVIANGYEHGPHLGHDIVDQICAALGERPNRANSTW